MLDKQGCKHTLRYLIATALHCNSGCIYLLTCLLTYLLTYSMVQSPSWEANWFTASQEIPRISRNPKVHYRTHKRPPHVSIPGQPNPVHIPTSQLLQIHPNIIHPSWPSGLLSSGFPSKNLYTPLSSPIRATCPAHRILLDFITRTLLGTTVALRVQNFTFMLIMALSFPYVRNMPTCTIECKIRLYLIMHTRIIILSYQ